MNPRRHIEMTRRIATIAAIILLLGQTIAAAHFHPVSSQQGLSSSEAVGIADSSCAICAAHFHSPVLAAVVPALDAPTVVEKLVGCTVVDGPRFVYLGHCFGRAPPASI
jgi:hypothetical protein